MNKNQILEKITTIFRDFFDDEKLTLTTRTTNEDIEDWDSVAHIQLIFEIECEFNIQFEAEEILEMTSIDKIINTIEKYI